MSQDELIPECGRIQSELPSLLYDECAPDARAAVEAHLAGCAACREEWEALRDTRALLSRWETPVSGEDPRAIARGIAAGATPASARGPRRARLVRWSARLSGAAAAVLFLLSVLNTQVTSEGGQVRISFGLPGARPAESAPSSDWREEARSIAAQEIETRTAGLENSQEELFQRCSLMTQQELLRLSQAVDLALARSQEQWDTRLASFGREAARADLETRRVVTDLAAATLPVSSR